MGDTGTAIKSAFVSGAIAFAFTVVIVIVSLLAGSVFAASLAAFPFTLCMFAIAATIYNTEAQKQNFERFLLLSAALYIVLAVGVGIWWLVSYYALKDMEWSKKIWSSFGAGVALWVVAVTVLMVMYYHNDEWNKYFSVNSDDPVAEAGPPLPPPVPA